MSARCPVHGIPDCSPLLNGCSRLTASGRSETLRCPDGGTCHHDCTPPTCFRVRCCGPLSGVYPGDRWPDDVVAASDPAACTRKGCGRPRAEHRMGFCP